MENLAAAAAPPQFVFGLVEPDDALLNLKSASATASPAHSPPASSGESLYRKGLDADGAMGAVEFAAFAKAVRRRMRAAAANQFKHHPVKSFLVKYRASLWGPEDRARERRHARLAREYELKQAALRCSQTDARSASNE